MINQNSFFSENNSKPKNRTTIKKSDLYNFSSIVSDAIANREDLDKSYHKLAQYIESVFSYTDDRYSQSFYVGAIWGMIELFKKLLEKDPRLAKSIDNTLSVNGAKATLDYLRKSASK